MKPNVVIIASAHLYIRNSVAQGEGDMLWATSTDDMPCMHVLYKIVNARPPTTALCIYCGRLFVL